MGFDIIEINLVFSKNTQNCFAYNYQLGRGCHEVKILLVFYYNPTEATRDIVMEVWEFEEVKISSKVILELG